MNQRSASRNTALDVRQDDPRKRNEHLRERLWQAVHSDDAEEVGRILEVAPRLAQLEHPTRVSVPSSDHNTADTVSQVVRHLLAAGADANARNKSQQTALHKAAFEGHQDVVAELLAGKAIDVNAANEHGMTALHWAAIRERAQVVDLLLDVGASTDLADENGDSPEDVAQGAARDAFQRRRREHHTEGGDSMLDFAESSADPTMRAKLGRFACNGPRNSDLPVASPMVVCNESRIDRKCEACTIS